jgi:hypothetical protein
MTRIFYPYCPYLPNMGHPLKGDMLAEMAVQLRWPLPSALFLAAGEKVLY